MEDILNHNIMSQRLPTRKVHSLIHKTLPPSQREYYYQSLKKFLSSQLTKTQWDKILKSLAASCGNEIITLHNCLIKCIIYNAREVTKGSISTQVQPSNQQDLELKLAAPKSGSSSLLILFRDLNCLGIPSGVSETNKSVNIWNGFGDWIGSGVKYEGLLGKKSSVVGVTPFGVLPQTHYGNCSLSGNPVPKETQNGQIPQITNDRSPMNLLNTTNTRILSIEGLLPSLTQHPEMYSTIFSPTKRLENPFHSKYQDVLPFDFGSKGWTQTSFLYGGLSSALSLPSSKRFHSESNSKSAISVESSLQKDFPDLSIVHKRMSRVAKSYQVELPIPCVHMVIRAMESYIKTILENCINAKRQDELEKVHKIDPILNFNSYTESNEDVLNNEENTAIYKVPSVFGNIIHSYNNYKDEYEQKHLNYHDAVVSQHPRINRIITTKCLLTVLQIKPNLFSGNSELASRIRERILHSNWDLPFE